MPAEAASMEARARLEMRGPEIVTQQSIMEDFKV